MAAKPKPYPKSLGACADLLFDKRQRRLEADKLAAELKKDENLLIEHIINTMDKESSGALGKHHAVRVVIKQKPQVKDWPAFYAYVQKNKAYDMLQRRLSEEAINSRLESGKTVPGVELFNAVTVSLTKV